MQMIHGSRHYDRPSLDKSAADDSTVESVATAYNRAGNAYIAYADGDPESLFSFAGPHAYADRYLWSVLETKLADLRATGANTINILDAGCGPGTWLRRLVTHALVLGFTGITARGFDIAEAQVQAARLRASDLACRPGVKLSFDVADLTAPLPEAEASLDLALCLYSVLSHLPTASLPKISAEFARVTKGHFITTVRSVGSTPSIFVDSLDKARHFQHDHGRDQCSIELQDGRNFTLKFHLFGAFELKSYFTNRFDIEDLRGLDLFHSRFAPDSRWNPASLPFESLCQDRLDELEDTYARSPGFMERATHLLLVGRPHHPGKLPGAIDLREMQAAQRLRHARA